MKTGQDAPGAFLSVSNKDFIKDCLRTALGCPWNVLMACDESFPQWPIGAPFRPPVAPQGSLRDIPNTILKPFKTP